MEDSKVSLGKVKQSLFCCTVKSHALTIDYSLSELPDKMLFMGHEICVY